MAALGGTPFTAAAQGTSSTTVVATRSGDIPDGTLLLAWVGTPSGSLTASAGWTQLGTANGGSYGRAYLLWRRAAAGEATYSFTASAGLGVVIVPYAGAKNPVAGDYSVVVGQSATVSMPEAGCWAASFTVLGSSGTATPSGTDTLRATAQGAFSSVKSNLRAQDSNGAVATGSTTRTFTGTSDVASTASAIIALRPNGTIFTAAATLTAAAGWSTSADRVQPGAVTLAATTGMTAGVVAGYGVSATLGASSGLTAAVVQGVAAAATVAAASGMTAGGARGQAGGALLGATSTLTAAAARVHPAAATLTAVSATSAAGGAAGLATIDAVTTLTAAARQVHAVGAVLGASSSLTAAVQQGHAVGAALGAVGAVTMSGAAVRPGAAVLGAASTLTADARRAHPAGAALGAGSGMTADARVGYAVQALLGAATAMSAGTFRTQPVAAPLAAVTAMAAAVWQRHLIGATLTAAGALAADGRRQQPGAASLGATSTVVATGTRVRPANAVIAATSTLAADGRRRQPALAQLAATAGLFADAAVLSFTGALNPSVWAIDPATGNRTPLPHYSKLQVSPVRNGFGKVVVEYPVYGRNFGLLGANVTADRDLEVEVWLTGKQAGALHAILSDTTGDDVAEDAVWSFEGSFLEVLADECIVWSQPADPKRELVFTAANAGTQIATLLSQGQARGALAGVTRDFTTAVDSAGVAWSKTINTKYSPGATMADVLGALVELGMIDTWRITGARVLQLFQSGSVGVDRSVGARPVIFRRGQNLTQSPRKHSTRAAGTAVLVAGSEGLYDSKVDATATARRGRRVEVFGTSGGLDNLTALAAYRDTFLDSVTPSQMEVSHALAFAPGQPRPFLHFERDDWVGSDTRGYVERLRVQQWAITVDGVGRFDGSVVLNTLLQDRLVQLARRLKRLTSGAEVVGTSEPPPVADTQPPAAPAGVTVDSTAYADGAGGTLAVVLVGWTPVTTNADTSAADDVAGYRVEWRLASATGWQLGKDQAGGTSGSCSFGGVQAGAAIRVRVAAYDANGNTSAWSSEVAITTETDTSAPPTPSTPTVFSRLGVLMVEWDGLGSVGQTMPADFDYVEVHMSAASAFTPTAATYYDRLYAAGTMPVVDQPFASARYFKLVAVDRTDPVPNKSAASAQASGTASQVVSLDIFAGAVGSLQLANLAVTTAKINDAAINDLQVGNVSAGKITTGVLSAAMTLTGIIRTASTGLRWEGDPAGIRFYNSSGTLVIRLEGTTGNTTITGTLQSGLTGTRWTIEQDGTLRHYSNGYAGYSQVTSLNGDLIMRGRLDGNGRSGRINANSIGVGINFSSDAEIPNNLRSEMVVFDRRARITTPLLDLQVDGKLTPPDGSFRRIVFSQTDSGGGFIASSAIEYKLDSVSHPGFVAIDQNAGWKADGGLFEVVNAAMDTFINLKAANVAVPSSRELKDDVRDLRSMLDPLATIRAARARRYVRIADKWHTPPPTTTDPTPTPVPVPDPPVSVGVIAEELPSHLQVTTPSATGGGSEVAINLNEMIGVLWGAVGQIQDQEIRSVAGRAALPNGVYAAGSVTEVAVRWDATPLEVPTGGVVSVYAAIAWLGKVTALIKPGTLTATGCTVQVRALTAVVPSAANPVTVEAQALYLYSPPYTPET